MFSKKEKIISLVVIFLMAFTTGIIPADRSYAQSEEENTERIVTGDLSAYESRPSADELRARYAALPQEPSLDNLFKTKADFENYTPAELTDEAYSFAEGLLNLYRYQTGVADVEFVDDINANAAQGALLLAKIGSGLSHFPQTPEGISDEQAKPGKFAAECSNLSLRDDDENMITSILYGQIADDDSNNMSKLGHRRWLQDPTLPYVGIGIAAREDTKKYYSAIRIDTNTVSKNYDKSYGYTGYRKGLSYDVIAWPSSGAMLNNLFDPFTPWSATIDAKKYGWAKVNEVSVTVTRQIDGKSWTMDKNDMHGISGEKYFNVNTDNYGLSNVVIFNPGYENLGSGPLIGTFTVKIDGLHDYDGNNTGPIVYDVNFIDPVKKSIDEMTIRTEDVPFTGEDITENVVSVTTKDGTVLKEGTDYTLEFENNREIGEATVIISGKGNYVGAAKKTFHIIETEHIWDKGELTKEPTCKDPGIMTYTCVGCGQTKTEETESDETRHVWDKSDVIIPATCTKEGQANAVCTVCGEETVLPLEKDKTNHDSWGEGKITKAPTCSEEGVMTYTCACGAEKTETVPKDPGNHVWDKGTLTDPGTCSEEGTMTYTCLSCGQTMNKTVSGDADTHTQWDEGVEIAPPTCTEEGVMMYTCACGAAKKESIPATGHSFGDWVTVTDSSCSEHGYRERVCEACQLVETEELDLAEHTWADSETIDKAPTCTENGSESVHCLYCDARTDCISIAPLNHKWNSGRIIKKATCTAAGTKQYSCSRCGTTKNESIRATGHKWKHIKNDAGNLKNGSEYDQCAVCKLKKNTRTLHGYSTNYVRAFKISKGKKAFTAKWKKQSKANQKKFDGYQIRYSTKKNMSAAKLATAAKSSGAKKIKGLAKKTTYYVQVRTYTKSKGTTFYSGWTNIKSVKTK